MEYPVVSQNKLYTYAENRTVLKIDFNVDTAAVVVNKCH